MGGTIDSYSKVYVYSFESTRPASSAKKSEFLNFAPVLKHTNDILKPTAKIVIQVSVDVVFQKVN